MSILGKMQANSHARKLASGQRGKKVREGRLIQNTYSISKKRKAANKCEREVKHRFRSDY